MPGSGHRLAGGVGYRHTWGSWWALGTLSATGASYRSFTTAPHRQDRAREHDLVRDFDAKTPPGVFAALRDRLPSS